MRRYEDSGTERLLRREHAPDHSEKQGAELAKVHGQARIRQKVHPRWSRALRAITFLSVFESS